MPVITKVKHANAINKLTTNVAATVQGFIPYTHLQVNPRTDASMGHTGRYFEEITKKS
jgi:hypothetical protein